MKLADYCYANAITPTQLRRMLGVQSRATVWRWLTNERKPQPPMIAKIEAVTHGQVTEADFDDPSPPKCARWVTTRDGKRRMRLPWSPDYHNADPEPPPRFTEEFSPPVERALRILGRRAAFTRKGVFLLDGRVTDLLRIVRAANAILKQRGQPPIPYPGAGDNT